MSYRRLCLLDQRACGQSDDAPPETYTLKTLAQDVEDVRLELGHAQIEILAHSFGGLVALHYASRWPQHVGALVLVDASFRGWRGVLRTPRSWLLWARLLLMNATGNADWAEFHLKHEVANESKAHEVQALLRGGRRFDAARVGPLSLAGFHPIDARPLLRAGVQLWGIYGERDHRFLGEAHYLRALGTRVELIQGAGHFPFVEQFEAFHHVLADSLAELGR